MAQIDTIRRAPTRRAATMLLAALASTAAFTTACGSELSADSKCSDFLNASQQEQDEAVSKVASDERAGSAVTPLGRPNVNYLCANNPDMTLGEAVRRTG